MRRNQSLATWNTALLLISIVILVLGPSGWALTKYKTLYKFTGGKDGNAPEAGLIVDQAGNLYGTTPDGGTSAGTVFKLAPNADGTWTESVLYSFTGGSDGGQPFAGVILDQAGDLYGQASVGGAHGLGAVFKLTPNADGSWTESVLYSFAGGSDGATPMASLVFDQVGDLFGTTAFGGAKNAGTAFRLAPNMDGTWTETVIHRFNGGRDGATPAGALILDPAGNLFGTTTNGGVGRFGVVFSLIPNANGGWKETILHHFTGGNDGGFPYDALILDQAGNLYGTAYFSSASGPGVVFELTPNSDDSWKEKVLHRFTGGKDGGYPRAGLIFDPSGNLYGMTPSGGDRNLCSGQGCGVVFKLALNSKGSWKETVLHSFFDHPGAASFAAVVRDAAGNLYGTTTGDNSKTFGSVFELTP